MILDYMIDTLQMSISHYCYSSACTSIQANKAEMAGAYSEGAKGVKVNMILPKFLAIG